MIKIKRLAKSFLYAFRGITKIFREEQNFRIQTLAAVVVFSLGFLFAISRIEWIFLLMVTGLVMLMEILNSAVERVVDALKPRLSSYVKEIKDIMAAAVMFAALIAIIVGVLIFWPYFVII